MKVKMTINAYKYLSFIMALPFISVAYKLWYVVLYSYSVYIYVK